MPVGVGKNFFFHGAFDHKADAKRKEAEGKDRFIRHTKIRGHWRYLVLEPRGGKRKKRRKTPRSGGRARRRDARRLAYI